MPTWESHKRNVLIGIRVIVSTISVIGGKSEMVNTQLDL